MAVYAVAMIITAAHATSLTSAAGNGQGRHHHYIGALLRIGADGGHRDAMGKATVMYRAQRLVTIKSTGATAMPAS